MHAPRILFCAAVLLLATASVANTPTTLTRSVVASGGGRISGPTLSMGLTIGQPVAGTSTSATHELAAGFWGRAGQTVTAVDGVPVLPETYRLHPNTPNPFNPRTEIRFDLPRETTDLSLRIYDLAGRRIATLAEGPHAAGSHAVIWNGEDDTGRLVASGIYLYRLESPSFTQTAKLALVR